MWKGWNKSRCELALWIAIAVLEVIYEDWIKQDVRGIRYVRGSSLYKCVGIFCV